MLVAAGCGGGSGEAGPAAPAAAAERPLVEVEMPAPLEVPEPQTPTSDPDWAAKAHNKDIEIIQVLNVINPVATYITAGFEQHGNKFSPTLQEEWLDTQTQLGAALTLYEDCKIRRDAGEVDKQLFLDMEEVWQLLVKTGVAGVRTKTMVDDEIRRSM
jgi:hypothetical protein